MSCYSASMDKFARVVTKEMQRYGFDMSVVRQVKGAYNPATSSASITELEIPCRGIMFDLTLQSNGDQTKLGTLIEMGDKQLFIQPTEDDGFYYNNETGSLYPNQDRVKIGGKIYKILTFKQVNPSTLNSVLWECYIRG